MLIKDNFDLMYEGNNKLFNIFNHSESTLKPYVIDKDSSDYLKILVKAYNTERSVVYGKLVLKELDDLVIVNMDKYPLPGFVTKKNVGVVNVAPINANLLSDYTSPDVFACVAYTALLTRFVKKKKISDRLEDQVSLYLDSCFMGMFGKKSGIIGSYRHLIPKMKFIIAMYVHEGLFGNKRSESFMNKVSSKYFLNYKDMKLDYDFKSIVETIHCINDNNIISISENVFSTTVINYGGISSLPMFEDLSRMMATILMVFVRGNHIFSTYWYKKTKTVYEKLANFGIAYL